MGKEMIRVFVKNILRYILLFCLFYYVFISHAFPMEQKIGVGIMAGDPTGISVKNWSSALFAYDYGLAWSSGKWFQFHTDYLWHKYDVFQIDDDGELPLYYGIGARFKYYNHGNDDDKMRLGLRMVIGIEYIFAMMPFDIFYEVVPVMDLLPDTKLDFDSSIGIRFIF